MSDRLTIGRNLGAEMTMGLLALVFLVAYAIPIIDPSVDGSVVSACRYVVWAIWLAFVADFAWRFVTASNKVEFVKRNPLDLVSVVLPIFRPLRLLRLVALVGVLGRSTGSSFRGRVGMYVGSSAILAVVIAALAVLEAERKSAAANITSFGDSLWWAMTTISTVGYGDQYPVTVTGRLVGTALMIAGIALLGTVAASVASWLVERVQEVEEDAQAATRRDIDSLRVEIRALREAVVQADGAPPAGR